MEKVRRLIIRILKYLKEGLSLVKNNDTFCVTPESSVWKQETYSSFVERIF